MLYDFSALPVEIGAHILSFIDNTAEILDMSLLSKSFREMAKYDTLWTCLLTRDLGEFIAQRPYLKGLLEKPYPSVRDKYITLFKVYQLELQDEFNWLYEHHFENGSIAKIHSQSDYCITFQNEKYYYWRDFYSTWTLLRIRTKLEDCLYQLNAGRLISDALSYGGFIFLELKKQITRIKDISFGDLSLPQVTDLVFHCGALRALPSATVNMVNLHTLDLASNALTCLPDNMSCLVNLTDLNLSNNLLFEFPMPIVTLTKLKSLDLGNHQLVNDCSKVCRGGPQRLTVLEREKNYVLNFNQIAHLPEQISQLQDLELLCLSKLNLQGLPEQIACLPKLNQFSVFQNNLQAIPEKLLMHADLLIHCDHNPVWTKLFCLSWKNKVNHLRLQLLRTQDKFQIHEGGAYLSVRHLREKSHFHYLARAEDIDVNKMHSAICPS